MVTSAGASSATLAAWDAVDWQKAVKPVRQLQMRIAKAFREGKQGKVKALQWVLTHSFSAKLLAVKRVVQNRGAKTPGVDQVVWKTPGQKMRAVLSLKRHGYQTQPLKRVYISKKQKGKLRPLSIPVMACRAQQALYLLSLEPIAEILADKNAYGFRPLRSTADAVEQCFIVLARSCGAQYILETDIHACFDNISFKWLLDYTVMDKEMLKKWLTAGYIEKGKLYATERGTPQGGIISPTLLTVALSGLEKAIKAVTKPKDKVNVIIFADDLVITGATPAVLVNKVKPALTAFLHERGLSLSQEKTKITHIQEGFDFVGANIRKYGNGKLIIKPAKSSVKRFLADIRQRIKQGRGMKTEDLIGFLNPKIRGWANFHRHVCSTATFAYVDKAIFEAIWRWALYRHSNKGRRWIRQTYFRKDNDRDWVFSTRIKKPGETVLLDLARTARTTIKRHIKIRAEATPFDPAYQEYLSKRISEQEDAKKSRSRPRWWLCWWEELYKPRKRREKFGSLAVAL